MGSYSIRDVSIVNQIDRARKDLTSLKSKQYVSRRGLSTKKTESQLVQSRTVNVGVVSEVWIEVIFLRVTFVADSQVSPFGRLAVEFYDSAGNILDTDSGVTVWYLNDYVTYVDDKTLQWNLDTRSTGSGTIGSGKYYAKLIVYGTDTGRISWANAREI